MKHESGWRGMEVELFYVRSLAMSCTGLRGGEPGAEPSRVQPSVLRGVREGSDGEPGHSLDSGGWIKGVLI